MKIHSNASYFAATYFGLISTTALYYDTIEFIAKNELITWRRQRRHLLGKLYGNMDLAGELRPFTGCLGRGGR